jgi:Zn-dependent M16 (insulinase) family peptidase
VCNIKPWGNRKEGIVIPAQISYAAVSTSLSLANKESDGAYFVARTLLSYQHLWNSVRVQGGAYGAGFIYAGTSLNIGFYSYRDPTPARTLECYKQSSDFLRALAASEMDLTKFIIGAVGDTTPLLTPALMGKLADTRYLQGITHESIEKSREELLKTDSKKLLEIADTLDSILLDAPICIVGGKDKLDECSFLDSILTL